MFYLCSLILTLEFKQPVLDWKWIGCTSSSKIRRMVNIRGELVKIFTSEQYQGNRKKFSIFFYHLSYRSLLRIFIMVFSFEKWKLVSFPVELKVESIINGSVNLSIPILNSVSQFFLEYLLWTLFADHPVCGKEKQDTNIILSTQTCPHFLNHVIHNPFKYADSKSLSPLSKP